MNEQKITMKLATQLWGLWSKLYMHFRLEQGYSVFAAKKAADTELKIISGFSRDDFASQFPDRRDGLRELLTSRMLDCIGFSVCTGGDAV